MMAMLLLMKRRRWPWAPKRTKSTPGSGLHFHNAVLAGHARKFRVKFRGYNPTGKAQFVSEFVRNNVAKIWWKKFGSQTSDYMDRWKAEVGRIREEKRREESRGEEKQKEKDILGTTLLSLLHQSGKAGVFRFGRGWSEMNSDVCGYNAGRESLRPASMRKAVI